MFDAGCIPRSIAEHHDGVNGPATCAAIQVAHMSHLQGTLRLTTEKVHYSRSPGATAYRHHLLVQARLFFFFFSKMFSLCLVQRFWGCQVFWPHSFAVFFLFRGGGMVPLTLALFSQTAQHWVCHVATTPPSVPKTPKNHNKTRGSYFCSRSLGVHWFWVDRSLRGKSSVVRGSCLVRCQSVVICV